MEIQKHTQHDRLNGICRVCTLNEIQIKNCCGYGMVGDRACDTRHIPNYKEGDKYILCKHHINFPASM